MNAISLINFIISQSCRAREQLSVSKPDAAMTELEAIVPEIFAFLRASAPAAYRSKCDKAAEMFLATVQAILETDDAMVAMVEKVLPDQNTPINQTSQSETPAFTEEKRQSIFELCNVIDYKLEAAEANLNQNDPQAAWLSLEGLEDCFIQYIKKGLSPKGDELPRYLSTIRALDLLFFRLIDSQPPPYRKTTYLI